MTLPTAKFPAFLDGLIESKKEKMQYHKKFSLSIKFAKFLLVCLTINFTMSAMIEMVEAPTPLAVCPRCGRQVRIDGHCECEQIFLSHRK